MFVLLRHAHAVEKKKWGGLDADRPLSVLGREQADNLVATLGRFELRTLFTSPTARCRDTLAPLATARGLPIREHPLLAPDAPVDELRSVLDGADVPGTLWCTHGESSPPSPTAPPPQWFRREDRQGRRVDPRRKRTAALHRPRAPR